ncbi:hypothetical protein BDA96_08G175900 [Sorghum bicolor]|uniref:Uncharacterized protein n=2 Tax=Sorghum bicolor TaxID=4558 RepID=A0A921QJH5_SORBI|nr:hypothetical protein BDA96_08G175900 [Sorghum bicolor]OQU79533.1 hypothetical protein SORBI_3008G159250 [Sorghum bicolor]
MAGHGSMNDPSTPAPACLTVHNCMHGPLEDSWATLHIIHMHECKAPSPPLWRFGFGASLLRDAHSLVLLLVCLCAQLSELARGRTLISLRVPYQPSSTSYRVSNFSSFWIRFFGLV